VLLVAWAAVAESTHSHPNKAESPSCSICVVAHSSSPAPSCNHSRPVFAAISLFQESGVVAKVCLSVAVIGIRGPPVA